MAQIPAQQPPHWADLVAATPAARLRPTAAAIRHRRTDNTTTPSDHMVLLDALGVWPVVRHGVPLLRWGWCPALCAAHPQKNDLWPAAWDADIRRMAIQELLSPQNMLGVIEVPTLQTIGMIDTLRAWTAGAVPHWSAPDPVTHRTLWSCCAATVRQKLDGFQGFERKVQRNVGGSNDPLINTVARSVTEHMWTDSGRALRVLENALALAGCRPTATERAERRALWEQWSALSRHLAPDLQFWCTPSTADALCDRWDLEEARALGSAGAAPSDPSAKRRL